MTCLVGDIGGTSARFALVETGSKIGGSDSSTRSSSSTGDSLEPQHIAQLECARFESIIPALQHYLSTQSVDSITAAVIAVATPITGDELRMTNNHWAFSQSAVKEQFGLEHIEFINDFKALALSVPYLKPAELSVVGTATAPSRLIENPQVVGVIGPGTGLGVSGLIPDGQGGWIALQGEGGHVTLAPRSDRERDVKRWMAGQFGHVSAERYLSGPGLTWIHSALCAVDGICEVPLEPAQITAAALDGSDSRCIETLDIFCSQLGSCAANLALTIGAEGGVYIGGGIVPRLGSFFNASGFRAAFEDKGRMSAYLSPLPTQVITAKYPALTGSATRLAKLGLI